MELSKCCNAEIRVVGSVTKYYQCMKCLNPTDIRREFITFNKKNSDKSFMIGTKGFPNSHPDKVWVAKEDGEGGEFNRDELFDVIYDAIEKFYEEKF